MWRIQLPLPEEIMKNILLVAAINGFLVVALGAFGAHGLESFLSEARLETWHTAVLYHMFHTLALLGVALLVRQANGNRWLLGSAQCFMAGLVLFSGSLYVLALTGISWLGVITPFGGIALLAGWACLGYAAYVEFRHG